MNFLNKQQQLLDLAPLLWDNPDHEYHVSDIYMDLREADHVGKSDVGAYNKLVALCCQRMVVLQTTLRKAERLMEDVL